jgi:hypothetical protein
MCSYKCYVNKSCKFQDSKFHVLPLSLHLRSSYDSQVGMLASRSYKGRVVSVNIIFIPNLITIGQIVQMFGGGGADTRTG